MNTTPPDDWLALARRQQARAMAGDQRAANWCAKHAPALDAARGWHAYNDLWDSYQRLCRAHDRLSLMYRGIEKLQSGWWQEGRPEYLAWVSEVQAAFNTPDARRDLDEAVSRVDQWTPEQTADFQESLASLVLVMAEARGLKLGTVLTQERADRLVAAFGTDTFDQTCRELAAEVSLPAGKEQATKGSNGTSDKH
ncbi:MAG: hypothetical protein H6839_02865 [Planctomycetes bacterium]|nr:hypothetical protein [Planctomycetota bacterium]